MSRRASRAHVGFWASMTISTVHAASGQQYAGLWAFLWLALALAFVLPRWLRRLQASEPPVWLRLLLIRLSLRRATLGDAFDRMMLATSPPVAPPVAPP